MRQHDNKQASLPVLLPLGLDKIYHYQAAQGKAPKTGSFVRVPLGKKILTGVVWDKTLPAPEGVKLRPLAAHLPIAPLPRDHRQFLARAAHWTLAPLGMLLRLTLPPSASLTPPRQPPLLHAAASFPPSLTLTPARMRVLQAAQTPREALALRRAAKTSPSVIAGLVQAGALLPAAPAPAPLPDAGRIILTQAQQEPAHHIAAALAAKKFSPLLLQGVTGSGKTELLFKALAESLAQGQQALLLVPEIALARELAARFESRFGLAPDLWHSALNPAPRRKLWHQLAAGEPHLVIGARSALFLPFARLGLIAVDEEHEAGFKQEDGVLYQARDMALLRGQCGGIPVLLSSATPSLETLANAERHGWAKFHLPLRHGKAQLPAIELVDMRCQSPGPERWISDALRDAVRKALEKGEQAFLFLNRRGFAPLTLCRQCGYHHACPHCSAWLVSHRQAGHLLCHHCGHQQPASPACPRCGSLEGQIACGPGIERIAEEAKSLFPQARQAIFSADRPPSLAERSELLADVRQGHYDLLIGTQILAKGLHLPALTVAGMLDADLGLGLGDLRAGERSAQLLQQASGRAGRGQSPGKVFLQTRLPDHPLMRALAKGDMEKFYALELAQRRTRRLPPFTRLAGLIISAPDEALARRAARTLAACAPALPATEKDEEKLLNWLGPAPAAMFRLRGHYRMRFLVRAGRKADMQSFLRRWRAQWLAYGRDEPPLRRARLVIDVDPYQFL